MEQRWRTDLVQRIRSIRRSYTCLRDGSVHHSVRKLAAICQANLACYKLLRQVVNLRVQCILYNVYHKMCTVQCKFYVSVYESNGALDSTTRPLQSLQCRQATKVKPAVSRAKSWALLELPSDSLKPIKHSVLIQNSSRISDGFYSLCSTKISS